MWKRSTSSAARPTSTTGRAPGPAVVRTPDAPYTTRILVRRPAKRAPVQRQRRRRTAQPVQPLRSEHRLGPRPRAVRAQRRRLGRHHGQAGLGRRAEDLRPAALRPALVRQPAAARRSAQLRDASPRTARARPRTASPGTSSPRSGRGCAAAAPATRCGGRARQARLWLRLLADRRLPLRLYQRHPSARRRAGRQRRSTTATSWPSPAARSWAPCRSTSAPRRRRWATRGGSSQRRRPDHPRDVPVRLPDRHRRTPARQRRAAPTAIGTTRWPEPATPRPDELLSAAPADIVKARPGGPADARATRARAAASRAASSSTPSCATSTLWAGHGIAPPPADRSWSSTARPCSTSSAMSKAGCVRPYLDVRPAPGTAARPARRSASSPGYERPFDPRAARTLYPSHGAYVSRVIRSVGRRVAQRVITVADGRDLIREASRADVP